jgi:hypothetical protein
MSIDHFHFVAKGEMPIEIDRAEAATKLTEEAHTIYEMAGGTEYLYIYENGETAAALFERWRRQPVEKIVLTLDGVEQVGERLPVNSVPDTGCDIDISWDGDFDTDGDPNAPARWKVRCGRPVAGEVEGRPFCQKHWRTGSLGTRSPTKR